MELVVIGLVGVGAAVVAGLCFPSVAKVANALIHLKSTATLGDKARAS